MRAGVLRIVPLLSGNIYMHILGVLTWWMNGWDFVSAVDGYVVRVIEREKLTVVYFRYTIYVGIENGRRREESGDGLLDC